MATRGIDTRTVLSGCIRAAVVAAAYCREYVGSVRNATATEIITGLRDPWKEGRRASTGYEILLTFAVIPIVLVTIEATIQSRPWMLPLTADSVLEPKTALLAYTSSFVHAGPTHLWGNVGGYLLIMSALYPLAVRAGKKRQLAGFAVCSLLTIPLVTGQLSLLLPITASTLGFSAVNAAFLGGLGLFIVFAWNPAGGDTSPVWAVGPALASLAIALAAAPVVFPYLPPLGASGLVSGLLGGLLAVCFFHQKGQIALRRSCLQQSPLLYWGVAVLLVGFARLLVFIPANANLLAHLGGFYVGFFGLFALVVGEERHEIVRATQALGERLSLPSR